MTENMIHTVKVAEIIEECPGVKSLVFKAPLHPPKPGQFLMIWMPGVDEIPMSISNWVKNEYWTIMVKNVGECTKKLSEVKISDYIGVRGPLGNYFNLPMENSNKIILVGGGIGNAPLKFLAKVLSLKNKPFTYIEGARNGNQLMMKSSLGKEKSAANEFIYCTDDGSFGKKAVVSDLLKRYLQNLSKSVLKNLLIYTCGPEKMIYEIYKICQKNKIQMQASLERIMRCGCGICGLCAIDPLGLLVCKDGPIFNNEQLEKMEDFGQFKRDFTGRKISIDN